MGRRNEKTEEVVPQDIAAATDNSTTEVGQNNDTATTAPAEAATTTTADTATTAPVDTTNPVADYGLTTAQQHQALMDKGTTMQALNRNAAPPVVQTQPQPVVSNQPTANTTTPTTDTTETNTDAQSQVKTAKDLTDNDKTTTEPTKQGYTFDYTDPKTGEKHQFKSKVELFQYLNPPQSEEERKRLEKKQRRNQIIAAVSDGLSALANMYFVSKGAPNIKREKMMGEAEQKRMDDLRAMWQKQDDDYKAKLLEMADKDEANWFKRAKEKRDAEKYEHDKSLWPVEEEIKKGDLEEKQRKNRIGAATEKGQIEATNATNAGKTATGNYRAAHQGATYKDTHPTKSRGGSSGGSSNSNRKNEIIIDGESFYPSDAQVDDTYTELARRGFVPTGLTSVRTRLTAIKDYYSEKGGNNYREKKQRSPYDPTKTITVREPVGKGYADDKNGGADIDARLGRKTKSRTKEKIDW